MEVVGWGIAWKNKSEKKSVCWIVQDFISTFEGKIYAGLCMDVSCFESFLVAKTQQEIFHHHGGFISFKR